MFPHHFQLTAEPKKEANYCTTRSAEKGQKAKSAREGERTRTLVAVLTVTFIPFAFMGSSCSDQNLAFVGRSGISHNLTWAFALRRNVGIQIKLTHSILVLPQLPEVLGPRCS